ncbi:glycosyltransferase [Sphingomonas sp.]|jgi:poly(glycerol-phosphate) alpha-glucosyltransferase|uniref:glycosyltransferase n=1 Tax=Sphingomonas sp. TaxID=28214 RepID=UPI0035652216
MKVAFLSPSLSRIAGGIFEIERELALALDQIPETTVSAYGVIDRETAKDLPAWRQIPVHVGALRGPHGFGYSPQLRDIFRAADADIVHLHALWMYTSVLAHQWHRRTGGPYVTTANGMLEPWAVGNAQLKKRAAAFFYERAALRDAACLHVNTEAELQSARAFGVNGPVCIIPNGVTLPDLTSIDLQDAPAAARAAKAQGRRILLYLSRIHPKKNVLATLDGFLAAAAHHPDWCFVIAGWGPEDYLATLKARAAASPFADRVVFAGPLYDREKTAMLAASDAFVLASHSEGFPMAVLEALAYELPVAMTRACNLHAPFEAGAAVEVGPSADSIAGGLGDLFGLDEQARRAIGRCGRALVAQHYTWDQIARQMRDVYAWLLREGPRPDTVVI